MYIISNLKPTSILNSIEKIKKNTTNSIMNFKGLSVEEFRLIYSKDYKSKSCLYDLSKDLLGKNLLEVFTVNNIKLKTIRLEKSGKQKESMSFKNIVYKDIVKEVWEKSQFYNEVTSQFCFFVFQKTNIENKIIFVGLFFWEINQKDLCIVKEVWQNTKKKIISGDFNNFIKASDGKIAHIRPKGSNAKDTMISTGFGQQKKYCFWLNRNFIYKQLLGNLDKITINKLITNSEEDKIPNFYNFLKNKYKIDTGNEIEITEIEFVEAFSNEVYFFKNNLKFNQNLINHMM